MRGKFSRESERTNEAYKYRKGGGETNNISGGSLPVNKRSFLQRIV
jgi:hypothetical protein